MKVPYTFEEVYDTFLNDRLERLWEFFCRFDRPKRRKVALLALPSTLFSSF